MLLSRSHLSRLKPAVVVKRLAYLPKSCPSTLEKKLFIAVAMPETKSSTGLDWFSGRGLLVTAGVCVAFAAGGFASTSFPHETSSPLAETIEVGWEGVNMNEYPPRFPGRVDAGVISVTKPPLFEVIDICGHGTWFSEWKQARKYFLASPKNWLSAPASFISQRSIVVASGVGEAFSLGIAFGVTAGVAVMLGVDGETVGLALGVTDGKGVVVWVEGVGDGAGVETGVGVIKMVGEGLGITEGIGEGIGVGEGVGVIVGVGTRVGVVVGVGVGVGVGVAVGSGGACARTECHVPSTDGPQYLWPIKTFNWLSHCSTGMVMAMAM